MLLSNALVKRFRRIGGTQDLERAIKLREQALKFTPQHDPLRRNALIGLGTVLLARFERQGSINDLDSAISMMEESLSSNTQSDLNYALNVNNLAIALAKRFEATKSLEDLDRAITISSDGVKITSVDHPIRAMYLNNLGMSLQRRFRELMRTDDLMDAIEALEQAVALIPSDHPDLALYLKNLGFVMYDWFKRSTSMDDLRRTIDAAEQALAVTTAPPRIILDVARFLSNLLVGRDNQRAKTVLQSAVRLLPAVSPRALKETDQKYNLSQFADINSRAASLSLACGENSYDTLRLLELGRGIIASSQLEIRSDISRLAESFPDHAQQFCELRDEINSNHGNDSLLVNSERRRTVSQQFDSLLADIRQLDSFESFLLGPSDSELKDLAALGPIIVFNVSDIRSDAFLITAHDIRCLHLPLLNLSSLQTFTMRFLSAIDSTMISNRSHARDEMNEVLEWLWDVAAGPVLDELGFTETPDETEPWPRLWWVGSGLLNILPVHAAGHHNSNSTRSVIDRVISSYGLSLKSLAYARGKAMRSDCLEKQTAMLIGMPTTPGKSDLKFVEQ